jgi:energy-coupling factor transporter transmembrane protein EcfT
MIRARSSRRTKSGSDPAPAIGTLGRLVIFAWSLALVFFAPPDRLLLASALAIVVNVLLYPQAVKRLLRWRWLFFAGLLIVPSMLWVGPADYAVLGIPISLFGLKAGLQMVIRAAVVILAVDGFSSSVDIAEVAGLLERVGLPGLGFSMGVAVNLLPALRQSSQNAWRSLRMRGGFRRRWWRGLQLLLVTIVANALRRAEEIALAAEVRAFSPERSRALPIKIGAFDLYIAVVLLGCWLAVLFIGR